MPSRTKRRFAMLTLMVLIGVACVSCARHRVRDLQTGALYYTRHVKEDAKIEGAVTFRDAATRAWVTLTHFESERVSKSVYRDAARRARPSGGG